MKLDSGPPADEAAPLPMDAPECPPACKKIVSFSEDSPTAPQRLANFSISKSTGPRESAIAPKAHELTPAERLRYLLLGFQPDSSVWGLVPLDLGLRNRSKEDKDAGRRSCTLVAEAMDAHDHATHLLYRLPLRWHLWGAFEQQYTLHA
eukprot:2268836-Prymnesium_polylepis.2